MRAPGVKYLLSFTVVFLVFVLCACSGSKRNAATDASGDVVGDVGPGEVKDAAAELPPADLPAGEELVEDDAAGDAAFLPEVLPAMCTPVPLEPVGTIFDGQGGIDGMDWPYEVGISPDGETVYVTSWDHTLTVLHWSPDTGEAQHLQTFRDGFDGVDTLAWPQDIWVSKDGSQVLVGSNEGLTAFASDSNGSLELDWFVEPDCGDVHGGYVQGIWSGDDDGVLFLRHYEVVSVFSRDIATGQVQQLACYPLEDEDLFGGLGDWSRAALSPDGRHVYAWPENFWGDVGIRIFSLDTQTGDLESVDEMPVAGVGDLQPSGPMYFAPDGESAYLLTMAAVLVFSVDPESGALEIIDVFSSEQIAPELGLEGWSVLYDVAIVADGAGLVMTMMDDYILYLDRDPASGEIEYASHLNIGAETDTFWFFNTFPGDGQLAVDSSGTRFVTHDEQVAFLEVGDAGSLALSDLAGHGDGEGVEGLFEPKHVFALNDGGALVSAWKGGAESPESTLVQLESTGDGGELSVAETLVGPPTDGKPVMTQAKDALYTLQDCQDCEPKIVASYFAEGPEGKWQLEVEDCLDTGDIPPGRLNDPSIALAPDGARLYAAGLMPGFGRSVLVFDRTVGNGVLAGVQAYPLPDTMETEAIAVSPDGLTAYLGGRVDEPGGNEESETPVLELLELDEDGHVVTSVPASPGEAGAGFYGADRRVDWLAISPDGRQLAVLATTSAPGQDGYWGGDNASVVFDREPDGVLSNLKSLDLATIGQLYDGAAISRPLQIALYSPDGRQLYLVDSKYLAQVARDPLTNELSLLAFGQGGLAGTPDLAFLNPRGMDISPDGTSLVLAGHTGSSVTLFKVCE